MMHGGNVWQGTSPREWLDFSANLRPEGPPEWVKEALEAAMAEVAYYPDPVMTAARAGLARYLGLDEACVLPTAGGISAIDLVSRLPAAGALLGTPCFGEYALLAQKWGKPVTEVSLFSGQRALGHPAEQMEAYLFPGCQVWLCNPLNPVGAAFEPEEVANLLARVEAAGGWLAVDEAFVEYCPECSVREWVPRHPRLLVVGSMTKILGIPGARLGYLCAQPDIIRQLEACQLSWELNCFAGAVARALPGHGEDIALDAAISARRREALREALEGLGIFVYPSRAPFLLADLGRAAAPVAARLKKEKILVRECPDFTGLDDGRHLRLAVRTEAENARLIEALKEEMACGESR